MQATETPTHPHQSPGVNFPTWAGVFLGLGVGGFFDGIVLHQLLQWHHMATSAGYPPDNRENFQFNTLLDGLLHAATHAFVVIGLAILWRATHRAHVAWSTKMLLGSLLMGFGAFNLVEGMVNHLLGLHHVNEAVPRAQWPYWDAAFLAWGAAMLAGGWALFKAGRTLSSQPAPRQGGTSSAPLTPRPMR